MLERHHCNKDQRGIFPNVTTQSLHGVRILCDNQPTQWSTARVLSKASRTTCEEDIIALEFGTPDGTGKVHIPPEQLERIGNFDETCLSLDGSSTVRGGRPDCIIYNP